MPEDVAAAPRAHEKYERLIASARALEGVAMAVVHPCDGVSLESAVEAARLGLIRPVLVGPTARIKAGGQGQDRHRAVRDRRC